MKNWTDHIRTLAKFEDNIGKQVAFETSASMLDDLHKENDELRRRAEAAERERDEFAVLLGRFCRSKEGKDYLYENPVYESAAETLRKREIEQQMKAISDAIDMYAEFERCGEPLGVNSILLTRLGQLEQLRQQLNGENQ